MCVWLTFFLSPIIYKNLFRFRIGIFFSLRTFANKTVFETAAVGRSTILATGRQNLATSLYMTMDSISILTINLVWKNEWVNEHYEQWFVEFKLDYHLVRLHGIHFSQKERRNKLPMQDHVTNNFFS